MQPAHRWLSRALWGSCENILAIGTAITRILPLVSQFAEGGGDTAKKRSVLEKLGAYFERYFDLGLRAQSPNNCVSPSRQTSWISSVRKVLSSGILAARRISSPVTT